MSEPKQINYIVSATDAPQTLCPVCGKRFLWPADRDSVRRPDGFFVHLKCTEPDAEELS